MKQQFSLFLLFLSAVDGFIVANGPKQVSANILSASADENNEIISRRDLGLKTSSAVLATAALGFNSKAAFADDEDKGRLIEFLVENVGGEPGNTGRFVIKTNPEWAPNGVKRLVNIHFHHSLTFTSIENA